MVTITITSVCKIMINNYNYFSITAVHRGTTITYNSLALILRYVNCSNFFGNGLHLFGLRTLPLWLNTYSNGTKLMLLELPAILCYCT